MLVPGVESVEADVSRNRLTVIGKVDPYKVQDKLEHKFKKKVMLSMENIVYEAKSTNICSSTYPKQYQMDEKNEKLIERGAKIDDKPASFVLKLDLHCEGCANKIKRTVRRFHGTITITFHDFGSRFGALPTVRQFHGVESVEADVSSNRLTVFGKVDPDKVQYQLAEKTKKVVLSLENKLYEVFLSFRGEDTRESFTSHLNASLQNAGINVFMDEDSLQIGDQISTSLLQAIEESRISVIVFSRNYADSRWCLNELVKIMECQRTAGQIIVPVFYDVDPSEVRHQNGEFGKALQNLLNRISKEVKSPSEEEADELLHSELSWREVLRGAASISGFVVQKSK
ncbi:disease resistance protein (TIR-NBS-LRR class) [Trifolium pratense]|uniref:Disease resistance protein (TIR-NBS-LRR class) n=1 Tax=Trifolium pratense TaxID=57577 RepID=A0A2K3LMK6_TRIPR|nr:disease resistance protein (TIR-NBS-LRR class) [Trifolium pratense]